MSSLSVVIVSVDSVCLLVCAIAIYFDIRYRRIPNLLTYPAVLIAIIANILIGIMSVGWVDGLMRSLAGMLFLLLIFGFLSVIRFVGMGDVKLMTAVGAFLGWPLVIWDLAYVTLAGGVIAFLYAIAKGRLFSVIMNLFRISKRLIGQKEEIRLHTIPYALAIGVGTIWTILQKYWASLNFL